MKMKVFTFLEQIKLAYISFSYVSMICRDN